MGSSASIPEPERTELNQQIALVIKAHEERYGELTYIHPSNEPVMDFSTSVSGSELTQHLALTIKNHKERFSSTSIPDSELTEITQHLALFIKNHEQRHGKLTHIHPPNQSPSTQKPRLHPPTPPTQILPQLLPRRSSLQHLSRNHSATACSSA